MPISNVAVQILPELFGKNNWQQIYIYIYNIYNIYIYIIYIRSYKFYMHIFTYKIFKHQMIYFFKSV